MLDAKCLMNEYRGFRIGNTGRFFIAPWRKDALRGFLWFEKFWWSCLIAS